MSAPSALAGGEEHFDLVPALIAEDVEAPILRVFSQALADEASQPVESVPEIHRLRRPHDADRRGQHHHGRTSSARTTWRSASGWNPLRTLSVWPPTTSSIGSALFLAAAMTLTGTKDVFAGATGLVARRRGRVRPPSRRRISPIQKCIDEAERLSPLQNSVFESPLAFQRRIMSRQNRSRFARASGVLSPAPGYVALAIALSLKNRDGRSLPGFQAGNNMWFTGQLRSFRFYLVSAQVNEPHRRLPGARRHLEHEVLLGPPVAQLLERRDLCWPKVGVGGFPVEGFEEFEWVRKVNGRLFADQLPEIDHAFLLSSLA